MRGCLSPRRRGPAPEPPVLVRRGRRAQLLLGSEVLGDQLSLLHPLLQVQPQYTVSGPFLCSALCPLHPLPQVLPSPCLWGPQQ